MEQIKISAKNLGQVALEDFCPRCYWIKLKTSNKLPYQIFPGIFSSIDAYTKKCAHALIEKDNLSLTEALNTTREIYDMKTVPEGTEGCKDCEALSGITRLLADTPPL